jgi:uncharacterized protein YjaG (DUF416 family)
MKTRSDLLEEFGFDRQSLAKLSNRKQLAFALLLFDRMLPLLLSFSKRTGFGVSQYLDGKAALWNTLLQGDPKMKSNWPALRRTCLSGAPDTEKYVGELVSHALNATLSMASKLNFADKGRLDDLTEVVALARDSIDLHIQSQEVSLISSSDASASIHNHLMKAEFERQNRDLEFLANLPEEFTGRSASKLLSRAENQPPLIPVDELGEPGTDG